MVGELTVRDMLMYTAELRLPTTVSTADKKKCVDEVIDQLGLRVCENTVIGSPLQRGVSGGQAKRVNIGLALITRPAVIFLDEPTSGLDSFMANEVAQSLSTLAKEGRTIVCTIHSPTSYAFSLFDDLLMVKKGRVTYHGQVERVASYLQHTCGVPPPKGVFFSLPEWLVDVFSEGAAVSASKTAKAGSSTTTTATPTEEKAGRDWAALFLGSELSEQVDKERALAAVPSDDADAAVLSSDGAMPGPGRQLATLLRYRMATHYKSGEFLGPRIGDKVVFGLLILALYYGIGDDPSTQAIQSTASLLYFVSALCGYGAAAFVPSLTLDRPLFYRELADGCYSPLVYYLSKFVEEAFLCIFTSLIFSVTVFFGVRLQGSFLVFASVYYLTTMNGICLAYAVAALVPNMDAANALLPTLVTFWMYFGGLFLLFDKIPSYLSWASWTSFLRYSWGAQMLNQYGNSSVGGVKAYWDEQSGEAISVLPFYGLEGDVMGSTAVCVALLATCTLFFATCGACILSNVRHLSR
jgi:ATP-binding cassette subfamily G (WHITE) protein 2